MMVMNEITFELAESSHPLNGSVEVENLSAVAVMAVEPDELAASRNGIGYAGIVQLTTHELPEGSPTMQMLLLIVVALFNCRHCELLTILTGALRGI